MRMNLPDRAEACLGVLVGLLACLSSATADTSHRDAAAERHRLIPSGERGSRELRIDGDLEDWGDLREGGFALQQVADHTAGTARTADPDAALGKVLHDDEALYLALRVRDRSVNPTAQGEEFAAGDLIELFLDVRPLDVDPAKRLGSAGYTDGAYQLFFSPVSVGSRTPRWQQASVQKVRAIGPIEVAGKQEAEGYTLELRLPLASLLPGAPAGRLRQPVGLEVMIGDSDGDASERTPPDYYSWSGIEGYWRNAGAFGCADPDYRPALPAPYLYLRPAMFTWPSTRAALLVSTDMATDGGKHVAVSCRFRAGAFDRVRNRFPRKSEIPRRPSYTMRSSAYRYPSLGLVFFERRLVMTASAQGRYDIETSFPGLEVPPVVKRYYGYASAGRPLLGAVSALLPADLLTALTSSYAKPALETHYSFGMRVVQGVADVDAPPGYWYAHSQAAEQRKGGADEPPAYRVRTTLTPLGASTPAWQIEAPLSPGGTPFTLPAGKLSNGAYTVRMQVVDPAGKAHDIHAEYTARGRKIVLSPDAPFVVCPKRDVERASSVHDALPLRTTATLVGNPARGQFPKEDMPDCQARGVHDLQWYEGRIYVGCGDWNRNRGPIRILSFAPPAVGAQAEFAPEFTVDDESVDRFRVYGDTLLVPGIDSADSDPDGWALGNVYLKRGGAWTKQRTVPNGIHVLDAALWRGKLYVSTGTEGGAALFESADDGATWKMIGESAEDGRFYEIVATGDRLLVTGESLVNNWVYDGNRFERLYVPLVPIPRERDGLIYRLHPFAGGVVYTAKAWGPETARRPLYALDNLNSDVFRVSLFGDRIVRDLVVRDGRCYVLTGKEVTRRKGALTFAGAIYTSRDLKAWTREADFTVPGLPNSLEVAGDRYFVGLANHLNWQSADTASGNIYEVR